MGLIGLFKPEYLLRPTQLARRLYWATRGPANGRAVARLPWGWPIECGVNDVIGKSLLRLGVYDLAVSEVIWRLCDEGEAALDIGANIGYVTALLAKRVGNRGRVLSFEAHPEIAGELYSNVTTWPQYTGEGVIQVIDTALSDCHGTVRFEMPVDFSTNRGTGRVIEEDQVEIPTGATLSVPCSTLDSWLTQYPVVGVAKMDVEGHEEAVLRGAQQALAGGRIRDWVFEHHPAYPSPVTRAFESNGYRVFQIKKGFFGATLVEPSTHATRSTWEPTSYLATLDPARAFRRMEASGWQCLRASSYTRPDPTPVA